MTAIFVAVESENFRKGRFQVLVEADVTNAIKKNVLIPRALVDVVDGCSQVWTVDTSSESVLLPRGLKLADCDEYVAVTIQAVSTTPGPTT